MILKELSEAAGISGQEDAVREIILGAISEYVKDVQIDSMGNVLARMPAANGAANAPRVMLAAHMDEVGFMVTGHDSDGLVRFDSVGGIDERILPGLRVKIGKDATPGVIIWTPIHMNREQSVVKMSNLRIDVGASNKGEAEGKAAAGAMVVFDAAYTEIGETTLRGKAFDDRGGCALLVEVLKNGPYPVDVLAAFTVQEEVGLRGATVAARALNPDAAIVLECTTAFDLPNPSDDADDALRDSHNPTTILGKGPALTLMDRSIIVSPKIVQFLRDTAAEENIPYQVKTRMGGGTDGGAIHMANGGVLTAVVSVPCRYIHTPLALMNRTDFNNTLALVRAALNRIETLLETR